MREQLRYKLIAVIVLFLSTTLKITAQCPLNIGFESGTFGNWVCTSGKVDSNGLVHLPDTGVVFSRHSIIKDSSVRELDPYGHFPVSCPNGSGYSVKLGNDNTGAEAERISYTFTVPAGQTDYSIVYYYAVVFENPNHPPTDQPRFTSRIFDVAADKYLDCESFDYVAGYNAPGFFLSDVSIGGGAKRDVYCKSWAPVSIKLGAYAGKTMRLEFTTNDCTRGAHFGYAYIDVDNNCSSPIGGNSYCTGQPSLLLSAPSGYEKYNWYDAGFTALLGSTNTLRIAPPPPSGTVYALIITPYNGSGCIDTLYSTIRYINAPFNFNVTDSSAYCQPATANLVSLLNPGNSPRLDYVYYTDSSLSLQVHTPSTITNSGTYFIKATDDNGCLDIKPVKIVINNPPDITIHNPPAVSPPQRVDLTDPSIVAGSPPGLSYSYWEDASATIPLPGAGAIDSAAIYYIKATPALGCPAIKPVIVTMTIPPPPNIFSPNDDGIHDLWEIPTLHQYSQCIVQIFNRWGQMIFYSKGYSKPWDGKIKQKRVPIGTYYYTIRVNNQVPPLAGFVDVIY